MSKFIDDQARAADSDSDDEYSDDPWEEFSRRNHSNKRARKQESRGPLSKYWCFTSYNNAIVEPNIATYFVAQREVCPNTKREHWQGYVEYSTKKRRHQVQQDIGDEKAHVELRKGSAKQASDYCKKSDSRKPGTDPIESGELSKPAGNAMEIVTRMVSEGKSMVEIAAERPSEIIRYHRGINALMGIRDAGRAATFKPVRLYLVIGPTGCGKTKLVFEHCNKFYKGQYYPKVYTRGQQSWWCGYQGQKVVVIDDFAGACQVEELLQLTGGYGHNQLWPVKHGTCRLDIEEVIITSNLVPAEFWPSISDEHFSAFERRVTKVLNFFEMKYECIRESIEIINLE